MDSLEELWKKILNNIKNCVNTPTFKMWFESINPVSFKKNTLTIAVNTNFVKEWLETRYLKTIIDSAQQITNQPTNIKIIVEPSPNTNNYTSPVFNKDLKNINALNKVKKEDSVFNPKYSFDTFVEGNSNRFAYTAAQVVSEKPGKAYNPLFIYGGVGLGKTHLLHAIGQYVSKLYPNLVVKYVSAEKFLNDFINALRYKTILNFKDSYRNNDVLLVDDIQFLEEKEASQEEFFHTFNALHGTNRQIVLSSDRAPKDLSSLEDRLRSRFEWGLVTDIQPPNLETRIAILKKYTEREKIEVPDQIINLIAEKITSNIREMEGAIIRIVAFASFTKTEPDISMARNILKDMLPEDKDYKISNQKIIKEVSKYFSIPINTLIGSKRSQYVAHARQIGMYICRDLTSESLPAIGKAFGNRDHATVIYAISKINELISKDKEVYKQIQEITNRVKSSP